MLKYLLLLLTAPCFGQSSLSPGAVILNSAVHQDKQFDVARATFTGNVVIQGTLTASGAGFTAIPLTALSAGTLSVTIAASSITPTGVTAATYGSATQVGVCAVRGDGRISTCTNTTISGVAPGGAAGGALAGTYPSPNIANSTITNANMASGTFSNISIPAANVVAGSLGASVLASSIAVGAINSSAQIAAGTIANTNMSAATYSNISIPGGNITSAVSAANLPSTVAYTSVANTFTAGQSITAGGGLSVTYGVVAGSVTGAGLSSCGDSTHALSWASGQFGCQSLSGGGGGSSALAVTTGSSSGYGKVTSSPTAVLNFDSTYFAASVPGGTTAFLTLNAPFAAATIVSGITNSQLSAGTFSSITLPAANVAAGSLGASVLASSIAVGSINSAAQIAAGTITGSRLANGTITDVQSSLSTGGVAGVFPVSKGGTGASSMNASQIVFGGAGGTTLTQTSKLNWDDSNFRLGVGTAIPQANLEVNGVNNNTDIHFKSGGLSAYSALTIGRVNDDGVLAVPGNASQYVSSSKAGDTVIRSSGNFIVSADKTGTITSIYVSSVTKGVTVGGASTGTYALNVSGSGLYTAGPIVAAGTMVVVGQDSNGLSASLAAGLQAVGTIISQSTICSRGQYAGVLVDSAIIGGIQYGIYMTPGLDSVLIGTSPTGGGGMLLGSNAAVTFVSSISIRDTVGGTSMVMNGGISAASGTITAAALTVNGPSTFNQDVQALGSTVTFNATQTLNWSNLGPKATILMTANITSFTMSGGRLRGTYLLELIQAGSGSYTVVWPTNFVWPGQGTAPTLTTTVGGRDYFMLIFDTDGSFHVLAVALNN